MRAKSATQDRSREKRDRILTALDHLLQKREFADITIADLAKAAKVSPATIHQRFSNKDATLSVLIELFIRKSSEWNESRARDSGKPRPANLENALFDVGLSAWDQVDALHHIMRPAYLYSRLRPDILHDQWAAAEVAMVEGFKSLLSAYPEAVAKRDLSKAALAIGRLYNMLTLALLLHDDRAQRTQTAFARELADFALGYLSALRDRHTQKPARGKR